MSTGNMNKKFATPIVSAGEFNNNELFFKREDMIPYSFGGNKARKAFLFFDEIDVGNYNCVVSYGSSHSNHCRIVANMAAARKIPCFLITPAESSDPTYNSQFMKLFGAEIINVPVSKVHETIENKLSELRKAGSRPYFIPGGGHGNIGTQAYVNCYQEIKEYEGFYSVYFDYIFFASGTGTTQAGLVCGQLINNDNKVIVGISIARKCPYGREVVINSIKDYLPNEPEELIQRKVTFLDDYVGKGYGAESKEIQEIIKSSMINYGIPLDSTYTGKAFLGMKKYVEQKQIKGKKILFIHTGGTPLFFDDIRKMGLKKIGYDSEKIITKKHFDITDA